MLRILRRTLLAAPAGVIIAFVLLGSTAANPGDTVADEAPHQGGDFTSAVGPVKCAGLVTTRHGTASDDVLTGSDGRDIFNGLAGDDKLFGLGGDDIVCGGPGDDTLYGSTGDDILLGQGGQDTLLGGFGNDTLKGGYGRDQMNGEADTDTCYGGPPAGTPASADSAVNCEVVTGVP